MRKCGLAVPLAALVCGALSAVAAAQGTATDTFLAPTDRSPNHAVAANGAAHEPTRALTSADATPSEPLAGNPLWAIALSDLPETHARPLFSPSRRPPAAPVLAALTSSPAMPAPRPKAGPDHPLLTLVGTIVSRSVAIGVFVDETSHDVIRLRAGDARDGWTLSAVVGRAALFQKKGHRDATLALPAPGAEDSGATRHAPPPVIAPVVGVAPANPSGPADNPSTTRGGSRRPPKEG
jgi:general secretion pathway protein N